MRYAFWTVGVGLATVGACSQGAPGPARAPHAYTVKDLGPGRCVSSNDAGQVIGFDGAGHGFLITPDGKRTDLGVLAGDTAMVPLAINASGVVVGYGEGPQGRRAVTWRAGEWATFSSDAAWSVAAGIDDAGDVVGFASTALRSAAQDVTKIDYRSVSTTRAPTYAFFAAVREGFRVLPPTGGKNAAALAVSPGGSIAGSIETSAGETHAFLYAQGAMKDLGTLGGKTSDAYAVNDKGDVVGVSSFLSLLVPIPGRRGHAFLFTNGAMKDLGTLGGDRSDARSINASGIVVGSSTVADGSVHPFVYRDDALIDLLPKSDVTGKPFAMARAEHVADNGTIVGWGVSQQAMSDGATRCLLWTPSP